MKIALIIIVSTIAVLLLRAGMVAVSVPLYKAYWLQRSVERSKPGTLEIIALGDSAAQGVGASLPRYSYVGRIQSAVEKHYGHQVKVTNLSVSGAKIADVTKDQIPKLARLNVNERTIVTLDIGTNDVTRGSYGEEFEKHLDELLVQLPKQTVVADMPYLGKSRYASADPHIQSANEILRKTALKHNLRVVPLYETLKKHDTFRKYSGDFFHPSNYGYQLWFQAFWPAVDPSQEVQL